MSSQGRLPANIGLDLVRVTEAAALSASRWAGLGRPAEAERAAAEKMTEALQHIEMDGILGLCEEARLGKEAPFTTGQRVGTGRGPAVDVLADALEGGRLLAGGYPGALATVALAPRGAIWNPSVCRYMEKLVVDSEVAPALVPECLDAPAAWTLALVARAKGKQVRDLVVFVLDRPRHADLVAEIRAAGSHVLLREGGDVAGALMACLRDGVCDILMGAGGVLQGLLAACAVKAAGGGMLARLVAYTPEDNAALHAANPDPRRIRTVDELVAGRYVFFAATGVTDSPLLNGIRYRGAQRGVELDHPAHRDRPPAHHSHGALAERVGAGSPRLALPWSLTMRAIPWNTLGSTFRLLGRPVDVLRGVRREHLRPDLVAALTVTMVVLPQTMAYAILGGLPPRGGALLGRGRKHRRRAVGLLHPAPDRPQQHRRAADPGGDHPACGDRHAGLPGGSRPAGTHGRRAAPGDGAGQARPAGALCLRCGHRGFHRGRRRADRGQPAPRSARARRCPPPPSWWTRCRRSALNLNQIHLASLAVGLVAIATDRRAQAHRPPHPGAVGRDHRGRGRGCAAATWMSRWWTACRAASRRSASRR